MRAGQGYKMKAKNATTLLYDSNPIVGRPINGNSGDLNILPIHFINTEITAANATIVFPKSSVDDFLNIGDEVGVFNANDILCGVGVYDGQNFAITVWANEISTSNYGMTTGETYTYKAWYQQFNQEVPLSVITYETGDSIYNKDKISIVKNLYAPRLTSTKPITGLNNITCFPNPTMDRITFRLDLETAQKVSIHITNIQGKKHTILNEQFLTSGEHNLPFDLKDWSSGVYFYQVMINSQVFTERFTIVK